MRILFFFLIIFTCKAQQNFVGKTYVANISETCKDGVGTLKTLRVLKFDKNTVTISHQVVAYVADNELKRNYEHLYDNVTKTYKWTIYKNTLILKNGKETEKLTIQNSGLKTYDKNRQSTLYFTLQPK